MGFQKLHFVGIPLALYVFNLFSFCFDEFEHQVTLEALQHLNALFQVGTEQVSF